MRYLITLLAIFGMVISVLALREHYRTDPSPCAINDRWDCGVVNHSEFAMLYGVPVAAIGIAGYAAIGALALLRRRALVLGATLIGLAFALRLSYIEAKILETWCIYCVISQTVIAILTLLSAGWLIFHSVRGRRSALQA